MRSILGMVCFVFVGLVFWQGRALSSPPGEDGARPVYKNPLGIALNEKGTRAYVALRTADRIAVVDLAAGKVEKEIPVDRGPCEVVLSGGRLFVPCEEADCLLVVVAETGKIEKRYETDQAPCGVVLSADEKRAFVICRDSKTLVVVELSSGKKQTVQLSGDPQRVIYDGVHGVNQLWVLAALPGKGVVHLWTETDTFPKSSPTFFFEGTNARAIIPSTPLQFTHGSAFVAFQAPRTHLPTTQVAQGWVFTNSLSWQSLRLRGNLELESQEVVGSILDTPQKGFADPADLIMDSDEATLFAAGAGVNQILALKKFNPFAKYKFQFQPTYQPPFTYNRQDLTSTRVSAFARYTTGLNPRRMALAKDGKILVVSNYLDDSLTVIDLTQNKVSKTISLNGPEPDSARKGEQLFHSAKLTSFGQFSCASCHPGGASDGLQWDLTRNGIGNFMNTRSLLGVADTGPYGWHDESPSLANRVAGTLRNLHHYEPGEEEVADLVAYLKTLKPARPLPQPMDKESVAGRERGKLLFAGKAKCAQCHTGPTLQDGWTHNVGTKLERDTSGAFDTPSLRGLGRTGPYLHHGMAESVEAIFREFNSEQRHGQVQLLMEEEFRDLMAYVKSL
jgi:YVTN family beta-propeller protein